MQPLANGTMVEFQGQYYFVQEVHEDETGVWYVLRSTALAHNSSIFVAASHDEVRVCGDVLN